MVMIYSHAKTARSKVSRFKRRRIYKRTDGQMGGRTDRRTDAIALLLSLMRSLNAKGGFAYFGPNCMTTDLIYCIVCRYVVMVCGQKAIHEALITKSTDFADRPEIYSISLVNPDAKGCDASYSHCQHRVYFSAVFRIPLGVVHKVGYATLNRVVFVLCRSVFSLSDIFTNIV